MRLIRTRQSGNLEDYIARFTGSCLLVPTLDELTKVTLFIEGLSDSELRREVRREHPKSMAEVTRAARTAGFTGENCTYVSTPVASASSDVQDQVASQLPAVRNGQQNQIPRGERLSRSEWLSLYRRRLCFKCQKPGHIAANCPSSSPKSQPPVTGRAQALVEVGVLDSSKISNSLLIVRVIAQGMEARALIDSGATHSFVSETWVRKSNIPTYFTGQMTTVTLADGHHQVTRERRTKDQEWRIGDFSWQESMTVIQLQARYDMVLGKPWLAAHNPNIDFARNTIEIRSRGKTHCLLAAQQEDRLLQGEDPLPTTARTLDMEFMNIQQASKALKRGAECIFISVKSTNNDQPERNEKSEFPDSSISDRLDHDKRQDLSRLLRRHASCFPRELPMKLPPSRRTDHEIKVEEGSRPPSRPPYRMSAPELDELQRTRTQPLGFINRDPR